MILDRPRPHGLAMSVSVVAYDTWPTSPSRTSYVSLLFGGLVSLSHTFCGFMTDLPIFFLVSSQAMGQSGRMSPMPVKQSWWVWVKLTSIRLQWDTTKRERYVYYLTCSVFNTLRLSQNGHHFVDDTFKCIFLNENVLNLIEISWKYVPRGWIDNNSVLVRIMVWSWTCAKSLSEPMMVQFT